MLRPRLADRQIAFARLVTDYTTHAYLCDVVVDEDYHGQGLASWMMSCIMQHPDLASPRRFTLVTNDAHGLYAKFGFKPLSVEELRKSMSRVNENA